MAKYPGLEDYVVTHERIHARKRSNGEVSVKSYNQLMWEEGATDLLATAITKRPEYLTYRKYAAGVATWARRNSGGDTTKAWAAISNAHYNQKWGKMENGSSDDLEWLLGGIPDRFEVSGRDLLIESEKSKWELIYKVEWTPEF